MKPLALLSISCLTLLAQPPADATPKDVRDFILAAGEALSNKDARAFLEHFDPKMPAYEIFDYYIEGLVARDSVISSIEIYTDKGDDRLRTLELDWTLSVDAERSQRKIVKVNITKQGKKWKITSLEPIDFFKPPS